MSKTLKINGTTVVPVSNIRRIRPLTDEDRTKIADRLDRAQNLERFQLQIEFADKSNKLAAETLDDIRAQGVPLVNLGGERYVPAHNIKFAEAFSSEDAERVGQDYSLSQTFRSRVETTAGTLLSQATPQQVIERREKAVETAAANTNKKPQAAPKAQVG